MHIHGAVYDETAAKSCLVRCPVICLRPLRPTGTFGDKGGPTLTKLNSQVLGGRQRNSKASTNELEVGRGNGR